MAKRKQKRVLVVGLDSAMPELVFPWAQKGLLPNIKKLMEKGAYGSLKSTMPPMTGLTWESSMTGKNAGKHGVFDFLKLDRKTHELRLVTNHDRKAKAIWEILSDKGKPVIVLNYPIGYPPKPVNGVFVAGMNTPSLTSQFTFPPSVQNKLLKRIPDYQIEMNFSYLRYGTRRELLNHLIKITEARKDAALYLTKNYPWQFLMVVFICLDRIQHYCFDDKETLLAYYKKLDQIIGEFVKSVDEQTSIIVYSDHGMGPFKKEIYINTFLEKKGFLKLRQKKINQKPRKTFRGKIGSLAKKAVYKARLSDFILQKIPSRVLDFLLSAFGETGELSAKKLLDWEETKVFFISPGGQGLAINLKNKKTKKYQRIRDEVIRELKELKDPETGRKVIKNVFKKEELYWGPYLKDAPDLIVEPALGYYLSGKFQKNLFGKPDLKATGGHNREGMIVLYGPKVKSKIRLEKAKIYDVAPTILTLFDLDIPQDMDGQALRAALK